MNGEEISEPAYRLLVRTIESQILSGQLEVGQPLLAEVTMAKQFGVNRSTVREAIRVLEQNGLVRRPNGGKRLFVSAPERSQISSRVAAAMVLQEMSFQELWEAMHCLEPTIAAAAAEHVRHDALAALRQNIEDTRRALSDWRKLVELDIEFHDLVAQASQNRALQLCREPISQLFYPAFTKVMSRLNAGERLLAAHVRVVDALQARNAGEARSWMEKHILDFRRGYELADLDMSTPIVWPDQKHPSADGPHRLGALSDHRGRGRTDPRPTKP